MVYAVEKNGDIHNIHEERQTVGPVVVPAGRQYELHHKPHPHALEHDVRGSQLHVLEGIGAHLVLNTR